MHVFLRENVRLISMPEEKILTINLRSHIKARGRRVPHAMRALKGQIAKATKAKEVKIGSFLNQTLWSRSMQKPPASVRIKAIIEEGVAKAEILGHDYKDFKPTTVAKREKMMDKLRAHLTPKEQQKEELEQKIEGKEEKKEETAETKAESKETREEKK